MKTTFATILTLFMASAAIADHHESKNANFETHKQEMIKRIDERLAKMQEHKTCVNAATAIEGLKVCQEKIKAFNQEMREEGMERRQEVMQKRMEKMKAKQEK